MNKPLNKKNNKRLITTYLSLGDLYDRYYNICEKLGVKMTNKTIDLISKFCEEKEREKEKLMQVSKQIIPGI